MKYRIHGYRHGDTLFAILPQYQQLWDEIQDALDSITEEMIIEEFQSEAREAKSISQACA